MTETNKEESDTRVENSPLNLIVGSRLFKFDGSWRLDPDVHGSAIQTVGLPVTYDFLINFQGHNYLVYPDDINILRTLQNSAQAAQSAAVQIRLISPEGEIKQLHVTGRFVASQSGLEQIDPGMTAINHARSNLLATTHLLQSVLENSFNPIEVLEAVRDSHGHITDFRWLFTNSIATRTQGSLRGKTLRSHYSWADESGLFDRFKAITENGPEIRDFDDATVFAQRVSKGLYKALAASGEPDFSHRFELHYNEQDADKKCLVAAGKLGDGVVVTFFDITDKENIELLNKRSQEILDSMNEACYEFDNEGNVVFVNRKGYELFSSSREDMMGRNVWDIAPLLVNTACYEAIQLQALEKKKYAQCEFISEFFGRWISLQATPTDRGCIVLLHEIEDIMEARENLQAEHRRLKEAQRIGHVGSFEWDTRTNNIFWSDEMFRIHKLKRHSRKITLDETIEFVHPEDKAWVLEKIRDARKTPTKERIVHRLLLEDGSIRYVNRQYESFADKDGNITHLTGIFQDITEVKEAEQQLKKNLYLLKQTEEISEMGSWEFDLEKHKFHFSDGLYKIFGLKKGTHVQPQVFEDLALDEDKPLVRKLIGIVLEHPHSFVETFRIKTQEKVKTLKVKATVLKDEHGKPVKVLGVDMDVTALTESEQAFHNQQHFINNIIKTIPDWISVVNLSTWQIEYLNQEPLPQMGSSTDLLRQDAETIIRTIHPDDVEPVKKYFHTFLSLADDVVNVTEYRRKGYDGEWYWFRSHGKIFSRNSEGVPTRCVNVVQNITEERRSQDELIRVKEALARQAQAQYEELFQSIDQAFTIFELIYDNDRPVDFRILKTNPALAKITGFKDITGKTLREVLPEAPDEWPAIFGSIVKNQRSLRFTVQIPQLAGAWYEIYAFPTGERNLNRVAVLLNDITAIKRVEETLRDRQLKLDIAQRAARVGIWTYDFILKQGIATTEWRELTGYRDRSDVWELDTFLSQVHPEDAPLIDDVFEEAQRNKTGIDVEFRIQHTERGLQWFLMRGSYIISEDKSNDALMGSIIDITHRKAFEEQKDQFIGIASHELKTPVTSIKAYAEILHEFFIKRGESRQSKMMERLVSQVDRLTKLINDLLDTTKIAGGGLHLEPEKFDLNKLISDRVEEIQRATTHKLIVKPGDIPIVKADRDRISQVLMNLISNAIKYSPDESEVIISTEIKDNHIIVSVQDFGIGLSDEAKLRIFERFYRVNDERLNTVPGLGLGLFIASEIIRRHHGFMGVESTEEKGSIFHFTLPYNPKAS